MKKRGHSTALEIFMEFISDNVKITLKNTVKKNLPKKEAGGIIELLHKE
jgi:hypothetical protein